MRTIIVLLTLLSMSYAQVYKVDPMSSKVAFKATKFMFIGVNGLFHHFSGTIITDGKTVTSITATIEVDSLDSNDHQRDTKLLEKSYFFRANYPTMTFVTTSIQKETLLGELMIKDTTKLLTLKLSKLRYIEDQLSFHLHTTTKRSDFSLGTDMMSGMIDDAITIDVDIVAFSDTH